MHALLLDLPPDPLAIARALKAEPGLALLHAAADGPLPRRSYVAASPVEISEELVPEEELSPSDDPRRTAPRWIGVIPYECARSFERNREDEERDLRPEPQLRQPRWMRYGAVVVVDHEAGTAMVVGDDRRAIEKLAEIIREPAPEALPFHLLRLDEGEPKEAHLQRIREAQRRIRDGKLELVNLARRLRFRFSGHLVDLYGSLARAALPPFGAALDLGDVQIAATSPELFLSCDAQGLVRTAPIKGTRPRGRDAEDDAKLRRELDREPKERAELLLVVQAEREALSRIADSVRLASEPHVETHPTVHHRLAILEARLPRARRVRDLVAAVFPSTSVTGVPKEAAMDLISELEPYRRGLYTGAFGSVTHDGSLRLAMAIRVLTLQDGEAHYFTGGGIVADSDPERELIETEWKAAQLSGIG